MTTSIPDDRRVDANPNKRFFIDMLVKDIELVPAIVDLVDNSVDAARALRKGKPLTGLWVHLRATPEEFSICDNCGGMEADVARRYAFRFGRAEDFKGVESSVGQFGIGMKRALFKLGNCFIVRSVAKSSRFSLTVSVDEWADEPGPDWTFVLDDVDDHAGGKSGERGTEIIVTELHDNVRDDFAKTKVIGALRAEIAMKHQAALAAGLEIMVNDQPLTAHTPRLVASNAIRPVRETIQVDADGGMIEVELVAGIAAPVDRKDVRKDEGDASQFAESGPAGWYVYCNERMVLAADKSALTGWGSAGAAYHPQYRRFRGYVFMRAKDSSLLPWNTTKTGLDQDSIVFRRVQQEMFRLLQHVQAVINRAKEERAGNDEGSQPLNTALAAAKEVDVVSLPISRTFVAPPPPKRPRATPSNVVNVQYQAPKDDMERVIEVLNAESARQAGLLTFQYFVEAELD